MQKGDPWTVRVLPIVQMGILVFRCGPLYNISRSDEAAMLHILLVQPQANHNILLHKQACELISASRVVISTVYTTLAPIQTACHLKHWTGQGVCQQHAV